MWTHPNSHTNQHDVLIKYLLDELQKYDRTHKDRLAPDRYYTPQVSSLLSEHKELEPVTCGEFRRTLRRIEDQMAALAGAFAASRLPIASSPPHQGLPAQSPGTPATATFPTMVAGNGQSLGWGGAFELGVTHASRLEVSSESGPTQSRQRPLPPRGVLCIPDLKRNNLPAWRNILDDWERPDPSRGLDICLSQWEEGWYSKGNATTFGTKYGTRRLIALAFIET